MEERQLGLDKFKYKRLSQPHNNQTVSVHGLCKCGIYFEGSLVVGPLCLDLPNKALDMPHTHYTMRCWKCGRLVNLVSIEKEPLKRK